ncbi:MAG: GtrA family protein [Pseudomonadota bacterium]|nr:GtrA family protein [Pseudomonadota bacterium]
MKRHQSIFIHTARQFLMFAAVGTIGFLVDAGTLWLVMQAGAGLYSGRVLSFLVAATATWALNRHFTFRGPHHGSRARQWLAFLSVNAPGGLVNYGVYSGLVMFVPLCAAYPVLAVGAGSIAGLVFNFTASRWLVFQPRPEGLNEH